MRHFLYTINGWPVIATDATHGRYAWRGSLVGIFEDDHLLIESFEALLAKARGRAPSSARMS